MSPDSSYGVYRIPENIPALPPRAQEPASARRNGDIPLRAFNHIVPMEQVRRPPPEEPAASPGSCMSPDLSHNSWGTYDPCEQSRNLTEAISWKLAYLTV